jgi:hypothetical protein
VHINLNVGCSNALGKLPEKMNGGKLNQYFVFRHNVSFERKPISPKIEGDAIVVFKIDNRKMKLKTRRELISILKIPK